VWEGSEPSSQQQQRLEFASVNSIRMREDLLLVSLCREHWGGVGSIVKVAMVIMASDGDPMGGTRRLSTGEIICVLGC